MIDVELDLTQRIDALDATLRAIEPHVDRLRRARAGLETQASAPEV